MILDQVFEGWGQRNISLNIKPSQPHRPSFKMDSVLLLVEKYYKIYMYICKKDQSFG